MFDTKTNTLYLPHVMNTDIIDGVQKNYNCINAGIVKAIKLGFDDNWYGGAVKVLGLVKEYGFLACPKSTERLGKIMGFLIPSTEQKYKNIGAVLTEDGKRVFAEWASTNFPTATILWDGVPNPNVDIAKERSERMELIQQLQKLGKVQSQYSSIPLEELKDILKSAIFAKENPAEVKPNIEISNGVSDSAIKKGERGVVNRGRTAESMNMVSAE